MNGNGNGKAEPMKTTAAKANETSEAKDTATLRDLFAMQALNGLIAGGHLIRAEKEEEGAADLTIAYTAYQLADAMLVAREDGK